MRLLMVTFDPPVGSGGVEGRAMAYARTLVKSSIPVKVASLAPRQRVSEVPYQGTTLTRLPSSIRGLPGTFRALVRIVARSSLDSIFLLSGASTPTGLLILGYARLSGRKSGVFFYGRDILQTKKRPDGRILLALSVLFANRVATNSRFTASLLPVGPRDPVSIIYPGVDAQISRGMGGNTRSVGPPRLLFVGRLVRRKGADLLLQAFSLLRPAHPDLLLDIVGDGPEMRNLRALAETLRLGDAVTFHGSLSNRGLWEAYSDARLFVMPSRESDDDAEGFGTVFLEAGVFGVPSVGTRTGGIPEAILEGVTGRLVEGEDVEGLRGAIESLLADPTELKRLGENARDRAYKLSWEASASRVLGLFKGPPS